MSNDKNTTENKPLQPLKDTMRCGLLTNGDGNIVILHDQKMPKPVEWVEFNQTTNTMDIIYTDGSTQGLGLSIDEKAAKNLIHGIEVIFSHLKDQEMVSHEGVTLVIKEE